MLLQSDVRIENVIIIAREFVSPAMESPLYMKLSRAFNGFDETYAINDSNAHDLGPTSYLSSKKNVVAQLLRTKVAELKNIKVSRHTSMNACSS